MFTKCETKIKKVRCDQIGLVNKKLTKKWTPLQQPKWIIGNKWEPNFCLSKGSMTTNNKNLRLYDQHLPDWASVSPVQFLGVLLAFCSCHGIVSQWNFLHQVIEINTVPSLRITETLVIIYLAPQFSNFSLQHDENCKMNCSHNMTKDAPSSTTHRA